MDRLDAPIQLPQQDSSRRLRYFTVDQANRSLVLVKRIVADVIVGYQALLETHEGLEAAEAGGAFSRVDNCRAELLATVETLQVCLHELEERGLQIHDWSLGVVDFPAMAGGREVYLCWQFGEPRVLHWHEVDTGHAGRRPIESLPLGRSPLAIASPQP